MSLFKKDEPDDMERQMEHQREQQQQDTLANTDAMEQMQMEGLQKSPELTKWQQDISPEIKKMVLQLRRQYIDGDGEVKTMMVGDKKMDPLCSEECTQNIITLIEPLVCRNTMLSNLNEDQILNHEVQLENSVILDILIKERKKNKLPFSNMSEIKKIFRCFAKPTLYRAFKGFEAKINKEIRSVKELRNVGFEPTKKQTRGFFGA